jgi:XTP/dITP diphosphohydrolase
MASTARLLLATNNPNKVQEYSMLLRDIPFLLTTPAREGISVVVEETGTTLQENAELKARTYTSLSRLIALADDSGLEVDALNGRPGPLSARFGGEGISDRQRIALLLNELGGVPWEKRGATFRCVIAIIAPGENNVNLCHGECHGIITFEPRGESGFGYDPIFYLPGLDRTMGELPLEEKNHVSHRGLAARKAGQILEHMG